MPGRMDLTGALKAAPDGDGLAIPAPEWRVVRPCRNRTRVADAPPSCCRGKVHPAHRLWLLGTEIHAEDVVDEHMQLALGRRLAIGADDQPTGTTNPMLFGGGV